MTQENEGRVGIEFEVERLPDAGYLAKRLVPLIMDAVKGHLRRSDHPTVYIRRINEAIPVGKYDPDQF